MTKPTIHNQTEATMSTMKPADVRVDDKPYYREYRKTPRGSGGWAFCTVSPNRADYLDHMLWERGAYGAAKRAAKLRAAGLNVSVLYVCS
jgi:hypothetical protein